MIDSPPWLEPFWDSLDFPYGEEAPLVKPEQLGSWVIQDDDHFLVFNKPGWLVCHPSKAGPWSSLVGAAREWRGLDRIHLVARLDRETSGVVVLARHRLAARSVQMAIERREAEKTYLALLHGEMKEPIKVDTPIGQDRSSPIAVRQTTGQVRGAKEAQTDFHPLHTENNFTLAKITLHTGRKHQIRVHALSIGHPVLGDKMYGPEEPDYLEFIEHGITPEMKTRLLFPRQALHCAELAVPWQSSTIRWSAPLPPEFEAFFRFAWPKYRAQKSE